MYYYIFGALVVMVLLWVIGSYLVVWKIEEPTYSVLERKDGYEIREYKPYIIAQTSVTGDYDQATREGFTLIADYIFGNNTKKESLAMTAPVLEQQTVAASEKIAMTVPVLERVSGNENRIIAFVLPSKYSLETLPQPNNPAVTLVEVPSRKVAALTFTWYATAERVEAKKSALREYLKRDGLSPAGVVETARYNPPLSMPLTLRNEILIPVE